MERSAFGILAILKYFRVYLQAIQIPGLSFDLGIVLIPLGISFYTFQSAAYIIDLHCGKISAGRNLAKFALFTSFFPQIVQGLIARHSQLAAQLCEGHCFAYVNLAHGAQLVLWGRLSKKAKKGYSSLAKKDTPLWAIAAKAQFNGLQIRKSPKRSIPFWLVVS